MKKSIALLLMVVCSGCAREHVKPEADLSYMSVERDNRYPIYDVSYSSNINLLDLFDRGEGVGYAAAFLVCALGNDQDFSIGHHMQFAALGSIKGDGQSQEKGTFNYVTSALLSEVSNSGGSRRNLASNELNEILADKSSIPCRVRITAYGYETYYSNAMYIPTADLLREINKPILK